MCLHVVCLITIYLLPRFIRGERPKASTVSVTASNGVHHSVSSVSETKANGAQANEMNNHQSVKIEQSDNNNSQDYEKIIDNVPNKRNQCDTNVNTETRLGSDNGMNVDVRASAGDTLSADVADYRREISTDNHLSLKIRERIDSETRNIEEFIDKTVTGIVELKDDLMRVNDDEMYSVNGSNDNTVRKRNLPDLTNGKEIETFLRKEINNANVNVLPAVLSNSHAD